MARQATPDLAPPAGASPNRSSPRHFSLSRFLGRLTAPLWRPLIAVRNRWLNRFLARRGPLTPPLSLSYRRIFILPTSFGLGFWILLAVMGVGALNYNNNLALIMTFTLASVAMFNSNLTHRNLAGLNIQAVTADPVFAGQTAVFRLWLEDRDGRYRHQLQSALDRIHDCADLAALGHGSLQLFVPAVRRGLLGLPRARVESRYPLGFYRAWSWLQPDTRCIVYPKPHSNPPPLPLTGPGQKTPKRTGQGDQLHSLREYRENDPLNRIAWRASARHGQLYSKVMVQPSEQQVHLDWHALSARDTEERLSILCAWVLMAEQSQLPYSLRLPGAERTAGLGPRQRAACLKQLALFDA